MTLTGLEVQLNAFCVNTFQQGCNISCTQFVGGDDEAEAVNALVQDVQGLGVGFVGALTLDVLTDVPLVVGGLVAAQVGELAGKGVGVGQLVHVLLAVERFHGETFVGSPNHLLLIVCSLEVNLNLVAPFLAAWGSEIREKFFFAICHSFN